MYSDRWSPGLRQGDIFGEFPFPLLKGKESWTYPGFSVSGTAVPTHVSITTPLRWAIVVSHDCEFNEGKRTHFVVARLDSINKKTSDEEIEELRAANDYEAAADNGIPVPLDTFFLEPVPGAFDSPMLANFACLASLPTETHQPEALRLKKAELLQEHRELLRGRLGVFFARHTADIPDDEKKPPPESPAEPDMPQPEAAS